ncbi:MAG TPA: protein-disulfide reductase DsbD domain-containing protein [Rhizomicrobium sp.]|nr:protein-disulfide reductase DsbD domain-containing protein [Rhizomicrobium sp.]
MGRLVLAFAIYLLGVAGAAAQIDSEPKVQARLIAETGEVAPGGEVSVALEEIIRPGWHTYWINPGEAGLPTEIKWSLPPGWRAGPIQWPYPKRLPVGTLMNYGYENKVWLLTDLTAPSDTKPGVVVLKAHAGWLVCKEVCIPEEADVSLPLTVSATPSSPYPTIEDRFASARAKLPSPSPWPVTFHASGNLDLFIASPELAKSPLKSAVFFPLAGRTITDFAPQQVATVADGLVLRLKPAKANIGNLLSGVLALESNDGSVRALTIRAKPGSAPPAAFGQSSAAGLTLVLALLLALLGGIILNLMPCVLPVLAMKALAIARQAHGSRREAVRESLAYGAGAILSFVLFGIAIVLFRQSGQAIGWGFQLQEPMVVAGFALLIFVVGLNLSGVFEVPGVGTGEALTRRGGAIGSFFTGVLAVAVAAPCTAPFMAAALGYAVTQAASTALLVFVALGTGFALPFVLIGLSPALVRWLPRPGPWMLRFRQFLAFPMYATALWLVWVFSFQTEPARILLLLALALIVAFALWIFGTTQASPTRWRILGWIALALAVIAVPQFLPQLHAARLAPPRGSVDLGVIPFRPYTAALLRDTRAQNRPVFVNATAAWCITCLVNEKVAFSSAKVRDAFARKHVAYLVGDWTNRNPEITALLQAYGRTGVPLYLYFPPGVQDARILPQVLTESDVLRAIGSQ